MYSPLSRHGQYRVIYNKDLKYKILQKELKKLQKENEELRESVKNMEEKCKTLIQEAAEKTK